MAKLCEMCELKLISMNILDDYVSLIYRCPHCGRSIHKGFNIAYETEFLDGEIIDTRYHK